MDVVLAQPIARLVGNADERPALEYHALALLHYVPQCTVADLSDPERLRAIVWNKQLSNAEGLFADDDDWNIVHCAVDYFRRHVLVAAQAPTPSAPQDDMTAFPHLKAIAARAVKKGQIRDDAMFQFYTTLITIDNEAIQSAAREVAMCLAIRMPTAFRIERTLHYLTRFIQVMGIMANTRQTPATFPLTMMAEVILSNPEWEKGPVLVQGDASLAEQIDAILIKRGERSVVPLARNTYNPTRSLLLPVGRRHFWFMRKGARLRRIILNLCDTILDRVEKASNPDLNESESLMWIERLASEDAATLIKLLESDTRKGRTVILFILRPMAETILTRFGGFIPELKQVVGVMSVEQLTRLRTRIMKKAQTLRDLRMSDKTTGKVLLQEAYNIILENSEAPSSTYVLLAGGGGGRGVGDGGDHEEVALRDRLWKIPHSGSNNKCETISGDIYTIKRTKGTDAVLHLVRDADGQSVKAFVRAFAQRVGKHTLLVVYQ